MNKKLFYSVFTAGALAVLGVPALINSDLTIVDLHRKCEQRFRNDARSRAGFSDIEPKPGYSISKYSHEVVGITTSAGFSVARTNDCGETLSKSDAKYTIGLGWSVNLDANSSSEEKLFFRDPCFSFHLLRDD